MRIDVPMPRLGQSMEEGRVLRWLKDVGATVKRGEPLVEIESDKANVEIEAQTSGTLASRLVAEGEVAAVGVAIAVIDDGVAAPAPARVNASPLARRLAEEHGIDLTQLTGSGPDGRIGKEDIERQLAARRSAERPARVNASPVAKRLAEEHGVDLGQLTGTGPDGRIGKEDVLAWVAARQPAPAVEPASESLPAAPTAPRRALSRMRQTIARRMTHSKATVPHFYVSMDLDMSRALALRDSLKARGHAVTVNDVVLKATALALAQHPALNAALDGDAIVTYPQIDLALAVAVDDGLLTPVLHGCEALSLKAIAVAAQALVERARTGRLQPEDLQGGTFTVTNLGMFGVKQFEAIVNPPQAAILALGVVRREPAFDEQDRVVVAQRLTATLSADHRVTDGAEAARFLRTLNALLADGFVLAE